MVVNVAHDKGITVPLEGHAVLGIDISFENPQGAFHRMAAKPGVAKIGIQNPQCFIHFVPQCH